MSILPEDDGMKFLLIIIVVSTICGTLAAIFGGK